MTLSIKILTDVHDKRFYFGPAGDVWCRANIVWELRRGRKEVGKPTPTNRTKCLGPCTDVGSPS